MTDEITATSVSAANAALDPFAEAKAKLFPPLRNRTLKEAADALAANRVGVAGTLVSTFLQKRPADPDALNLMAEIARRSKRPEDAEQFLSRCVKHSPDHAGYKYNYAIVLGLRQKDELALAQLDDLLRKDSQNPLYRDQKSAVLTRLGRHAEALVYRRQLAEDYPQSPDVWLGYGRALRDEGSQERCIAAFHRALELAPSLSAAYVSLAELKVYRFTAAEIACMEEQLAVPGLSSDVRADLHHALGSAYEKEKLYAKSFDNYAKGNALRRLGVDFDPDRLPAHRSNCESLFTIEFYRERIGWGCSSDAPIFIVGMPRSGSTLLEQILASHSAIEGLGELVDVGIILVRPLAGTEGKSHPDQFGNGGTTNKIRLMRDYLQALERLDAVHFRSEGEKYLEFTGRRRETARPFFTDKTLSNYSHIGMIHLILPNARIIDIRRHPLDCGWSCFRSQFGGANQPFSFRLGEIGRHYANYVGLMAHFDRVLPGRVHRVFYEDLVADPRTELLRLFDYLKLPFEEACLRFHENRRAVATLSSAQVRQPLYRSGVGQWLPYQPWLGPLKTALGPVLDNYPHPPEY